MNDADLEKRKARAANETLVISKTDGGYRVYNPSAIANLYMVADVHESPRYNCPDFQTHQDDPEWRCKHILAVLKHISRPQTEPPQNNTAVTARVEPAQKDVPPGDKKTKRPVGNTQSQMVIKRSVSPDGRIDSLSIELSTPVGTEADDQIKQKAEKALLIQSEIVDAFLKRNGNGKSRDQNGEKATGNGNASRQTPDGGDAMDSSEGAVHAQLISVGGMTTRNGWKLFISVDVNGRSTKLFGSKRELGDHVAAAGFASIADHISQGMALNLPCRVVAKPSADGRYLNIERVLPLKPMAPTGRAPQ